MGLLGDIFGKITGKEPEGEEIPDEETRDKFLRSLRRQRRTQLEEIEKEQLKKDISAFEKERMRRNMFSFKTAQDRMEEKRGLLIKEMAKKKKAKDLLKEKGMFSQNSGMLRGKQNVIKKTKQKGMSFLGKSNL